MRLLVAALSLGLAAGLVLTSSDGIPVADDVLQVEAPLTDDGDASDRYDAPIFLFALTDAVTTETSGVVSASRSDDVLFVHNDSPRANHLPWPLSRVPWPFEARFQAIDATGELLAVYTLEGAYNRDWEDIARGPGLDGTGSALWIGEIGDNNQVWSRGITAYVIPEPVVDAGGRGVEISLDEAIYDKVQFVYPDGSRNAEALAVHPATGRLAVLTKSEGVDELFLAPEVLMQWPARNELELALSFEIIAPVGHGDLDKLRRITGADWSPSGDRFVLTTYRDVYEWDAVGDDLAATLATPPAMHMLLPPEHEMGQVEAITYTPDGRDLIVISEQGETDPPRPAYVFRGR